VSLSPNAELAEGQALQVRMTSMASEAVPE
jgi:hypothetical protein